MKPQYFMCILLCLINASINHLAAQTLVITEADNLPRISRQIFLGVGIGHGYLNRILGVNGNFIANNNWGLNLAYRFNTRTRAVDLPTDYDPALCFFKFNCLPNDNVKIVSISLIRNFSLPKSRGSAAVEIGPALVVYKKANFSIDNTPGIFGSNYDTFYSLQTTKGLSIRLSRTYPSANFLATQLAAIANINSLRSIFGLELQFILGAIAN